MSVHALQYPFTLRSRLFTLLSRSAFFVFSLFLAFSLFLYFGRGYLATALQTTWIKSAAASAQKLVVLQAHAHSRKEIAKPHFLLQELLNVSGQRRSLGEYQTLNLKKAPDSTKPLSS